MKLPATSFRAAPVAVITTALVSGPTFAGYTITQDWSAPTRAGYTLDFDEPFGPTGHVAPTAWQDTHLFTINAGDLVPLVTPTGTLDGNCFHGNSGVNVYFNQDVTAMSFQAWTDAHDGFRIRLFNDGEVVATFFNPNELADGNWFDIATTEGSVFDEVEIYGVGWPVAVTDVDNLSWDTVYTITQGASAPAYPGYTLDFDEPFGPTGVVSPTAWQESHLLTINAGDLVPQVISTGTPDENCFHGNSGVNVYFDQDATAMSFQIVGTNATGGLRIRLLDDGEVVAIFLNPSVLADGEWLDITTANDVVFDEVEIYGFGFMIAYTNIDNLSWNTVYSITPDASAPTYTDYALDFDEPGGPTGFVSSDAWQDSHGVIINAGDLVPRVVELEALDGFCFYGHSGVNIYFDRNVTEMSLEAWTNALGGFRVRLLDDSAVVGIYYGSAGWFDITTEHGVVFDEIELYGYQPMGIAQTAVDNLSWNLTPCPGDVDDDGVVGFADLTALLAGWGPCISPPCAADIDGDESVGFSDLSALLNRWGPCE